MYPGGKYALGCGPDAKAVPTTTDSDNKGSLVLAVVKPIA